MLKKLLLSFYSFGLFFFLITQNIVGQTGVTRIHTDWNGYWTANAATGVGNRPDTANNLLGFTWNGTTYSTGVNDAVLTSNGVGFNIQKFRALKIQSLGYTGSTYFLQGSMMDGSATNRILTPALSGSTSTPAELASRLTDGTNGLALGTGIANIATNEVFFKVGTDNLNVSGLNDGIPDLIVTQVAQPGGADVFKFVDASGATVGNSISVSFGSVPVVGTYLLDLFNASNGTIATNFTPAENRDIRILGYDTSAFGINSSNAAQVDRFVVSFSGSSDCAFIAFNANSLKKAELSLVKRGVINGCGTVGDVINYTFDVTNTGDVPITNVTVSDPLSGLTISGTQGSTLAVGATVTLTGTYTIKAADVAAGRVINQATVSGLDPSLNTVTDLSGDANNNDIATVISFLSPPTTISGTTTICNGSSTTLTVTGGSSSGSGASIEWFSGACGSTVIGTGNSITVSPTATTTYYVRYKNSCGATSCISQVVTVNARPTSTISGTTAICIGASTTLSVAMTGAGPWNLTWSDGTTSTPVNGVTASPYTFSVSPSSTKTYTLTALSDSRCSSIAADMTGSAVVTVNSLPSKPVATVTSHPTCIVATGTITVSSPTGAGFGYSIDGSNYSNTTGVFTNVAVGTYYVRARNSSGCISVVSDAVVVAAPITNTWNGSIWSKTCDLTPPSSTDIVVFADNYEISETTLDGCSCQINAGVNVHVKSNGILKLVNSLNVSGTISFDDSTSLVQINDNAVNTGNIIYKRTTSAIKDFDYVYWGSPVKDQVLNTLSPLTDKFYSWTSGGWAAEARTGTMGVGKGYIIRVPRYVTSQTVSFEGVPNNGIIPVPSQGVDQNNLIGNPYPSAIDADAFINANSTMISGALYFWTHNTARAINGGGTAMIYTSDDYATYTLTGGTGTAAKSTDTNGDGIGDGTIPSGDIAAGQSFFVGSTAAGNFVFNNGMRISDSGKNSQFFKQTQTKKEAKVEKSRIWLNLTNDEGAFKQLLVGYITGATNDKDRLYDGVSNNANKFIDFYSQDNSQKYTIQGRALPFVPTDEVPLGYKSTIDGTFKIAIENTDGVLTNQEVYLEDKLTGNYHDLKNGAYSFTTAQGEFKDRFVLRYTGKTLGIDDIDNPTKGKGVVVSVKKHQIKVNSFDEAIKSVKVYDLKGSLVYNKEKLSGNEFVISQLTSSDQFVIVMIQLESGKWHSEEVILN